MKVDSKSLKDIIKSWYYYDKAFGWAVDEDEFLDDLVNHIITELFLRQ